MKIQTITLYSRAPGDNITREQHISFDTGPEKTVFIVHEVIHLMQQCRINNAIYAIKVNGVYVIKHLDYKKLELKDSVLLMNSHG